MYRILKLNESAKLEEKDTVQDYIDFCNDMKIEPKDKKSIDKYMNVFSRMYAQYNGLATLKAAKQKVESELKQYLTESTTEEYWDAKELVRDGFMSLMKFNFGNDSRGNNYIITVDANDIKRFHANDDNEAKKIYDDFKKDWNNSDHEDLTANIKNIAPRNESAKLNEGTNKVVKDFMNLPQKDFYGAENTIGNLNDGRVFIVFDDGTIAVSNDNLATLKKKMYDLENEHAFDNYEDLTDSKLRKQILVEIGRDNYYVESAKLEEADDLEDEEETQEDLEKVEDIEDNQEETLDSEEDQEENPVEEESTLDTQLDELRDILVDLDDIRLYKIVSKDNEEFYILGKVANDSNDVEMLVDTQLVDYENKEDSKETQEINPEEIDQKYQFVSLPLKFDTIKNMNPKYGEDLNPNHEELVSYLMNLLVEQNPEAAQEQREEKIEEPKDEELPEVPEEINSEEEDEDEEI